jgi:hypothetical protein
VLGALRFAVRTVQGVAVDFKGIMLHLLWSEGAMSKCGVVVLGLLVVFRLCHSDPA